MHTPIRDRFVKYMSEGIPLIISEEDQPIFYEKLDEFINTSDNDFESIYVKGSNELSISDKYVDYLTVSYEDSKLTFKTTSHTRSPATELDDEMKKRMGLAFFGVFLFVEKLAPSEDLKDTLLEMGWHA